MSVDTFYNKDFYSPTAIKELSSFIEENYSHEEQNQNQAEQNGKSKKKTRTLIIHRGRIKPLIERLETYITYVNQKYFGYDLYPFSNHDNCLLNIYEPKGEYGYHVDGSRSDKWDMKLTVLVNLSTQPYTGGDLMIFNGNEYKVEELSIPGSVVMIKSYLNHKVTPVLSGQRKTLTIFGCGPSFK
tara:strand:- start:267 stop:821 length:555 start_codon:yes stop_codon:yes gene_type:complete